MHIQVNGEPADVVDVESISALLDHFGVSHQAVAVIANGAIVALDQFECHLIQSGDSIEIIRFVGGG